MGKKRIVEPAVNGEFSSAFVRMAIDSFPQIFSLSIHPSIHLSLSLSLSIYIYIYIYIYRERERERERERDSYTYPLINISI